VLLPQGPMTMRVIINSKLSEKMSNPQGDLSQEYNMKNAGQAWTSGDFDLFPAGGGQVSALIRDIKPVKEIIDEMVS
jgi:enoyl-[acyl-carrier protein] reductase II